MLTARSMEADVLKGFDSGAVDYLIKPFSVSELAARVKSALARSG
jgi:DNA-binding response OmpR family regulator